MVLKYNVLFLLQIHSEGVDEVTATPDAAALDHHHRLHRLEASTPRSLSLRKKKEEEEIRTQTD